MTTWNPLSPDGSKSVKQNRPLMQQNTTYIQTEMGKDHYWDAAEAADGGKKGHHKFVQMLSTDDGETPAVSDNPAPVGDMDGVFYVRKKTAIESPANQDVQAFFRNTGATSSSFMQLMGIRACGLITGITSNRALVDAEIPYSHNIGSIVRSGEGRYTVTFDTAMPSINYLVFGDALRSSSDGVPQGFNTEGSTDSSSKSTTTFKFQTRKVTGGSTDGNLEDPKQAWFVVFGG